MKVWLRKLGSFCEEAAADWEFWQQMTADERVAVVEQLRGRVAESQWPTRRRTSKGCCDSSNPAELKSSSSALTPSHTTQSRVTRRTWTFFWRRALTMPAVGGLERTGGTEIW